GKSTTLAALLKRVNHGRARHIITIEDPIEFIYKRGKQSLIHQREVGVHVPSFAAGLRAALRESPDIIMVGEMRDLDTIAAALTAAETGHLVLSTLHCANAAMAIDRVIDVFPAHQQRQVRIQLASVLRAAVTQVLLPSEGGVGGRVAAVEKMIVTPAIAAKIREERVHQLASDIQTGRADGMVTLEQSLAALVRAGRVKPTFARAVARDARALDELLRG
ncbi:MAG: Flp pilus assembly complex ATPase component TadA, partial [Myxococcales bacterium]|nr:Flp pilus assembly complex ATPase component TadA [Myxococcales bacterium]